MASGYFPDVGFVKHDAKRLSPDQEGAKRSAVATVTEAGCCAKQAMPQLASMRKNVVAEENCISQVALFELSAKRKIVNIKTEILGRI